jgi:chromosome segregation ATPase
MPKDLKNVLDKIEANEGATSRLEEKVEKLTLLAKKQKKIIADQTGLLDKQKQQISKMVDIPDDIRELRELIGTQRGQINEREIELGQTKGLLIQAQKELELTTNRMGPMQIKLDASLDTMGKLKEEIVQKKSEILIRNETLKTFQNKITELGAFSKALQERLEEHKGGVPKKEVEDLKIQQSEERQKLKTEISKLDSELLNQKLEFQENITEAKDMKERYDGLVGKLEGANKKYVEAHDKVKSLEASMVDLRNFKKENINKISYLDMLQPLMEEDPIFKGFFIVQQVGSISLDDLKAAIGAPIVTVKKDVQRLQKLGLLEMNDVGKITTKKFDEA